MSDAITLTLPMPRLGETMEEGTIVDWLIQPGQSFKRGDPLLEVETDKTAVEYPALGDGTLMETLVSSGDVVAVGAPIAVIETVDDWDGVERSEVAEAAPVPRSEPTPDPVVSPSQPLQERRLRATPLARRLARQQGISLEQVTGTGRRNRIEAEDVRAIVAPQRAIATPALSQSAPRPVYCVHGFAGLGTNWAALRAILQRGGATTQAPDLPGHGRNATTADDVTTLVDWVARDLARQPEPVHLVGHSLGAHVAVRAAFLDPSKVARLTLLAPAGCGMDINGAFLSGMAGGPGAGELAHLMRLLGPKAATLDDQALGALSKDLQGQRLRRLAQTVARGDTQMIDTLTPLRAIADHLPVRAVFGLDDRIIPRAHAFHLPPLVACHMVEAGHMPHWDSTELIATIIAAP